MGSRAGALPPPARMKVWVTRAEPGAARTAQRLRDRGHEPLVAPLLAVRFLDAVIDWGGVDALAFTSANGVRALEALVGDRALPVFAVGAATAQAARAAGFHRVVSADSDVAALARTIAASHAPQSGTVLWAGAREPAGDLMGALQACGVAARAVDVYETTATGAGVPPGAQALLVHSPRAAIQAARLPLDGLAAYCISPAAAAPLAGSALASVVVAAQPDDVSLLALLGGQPSGG